MEDNIDEISLIKDMNIYKKIQKVKKELSERELKKSGKNDYSGFSYYELGDFLPSIIELCDKYGLFTKVDFQDKFRLNTTKNNSEEILTTDTKIGEEAILTIINTDKVNEKETYSCDVKELNLKGANSIQNYGGVQTYLRRYLYMNAFDIVEADMFDSQEFEKKKKQKSEKNDLDELVEMCKTKFKEADTDMKTEVGNTMKALGYASFAALSKEQNKNDIISLATTLKVEIPEKLKEKTAKGKK